MISYWLKCSKNTENRNPKGVWTKNRKKWCFYQDIQHIKVKNQKFFKEQEARGLLSSLTGVKLTVLRDLPLLNTLFQKHKNECNNK